MAEEVVRGTGRSVSFCHTAQARGAPSTGGEATRAGRKVGARPQVQGKQALGTSFPSPSTHVGPQAESNSQHIVI